MTEEESPERSESEGAATDRRVVVGFDGSHSSLSAREWAARQAELTGSRLEVVLRGSGLRIWAGRCCRRVSTRRVTPARCWILFSSPFGLSIRQLRVRLKIVEGHPRSRPYRRVARCGTPRGGKSGPRRISGNVDWLDQRTLCHQCGLPGRGTSRANWLRAKGPVARDGRVFPSHLCGDQYHFAVISSHSLRDPKITMLSFPLRSGKGRLTLLLSALEDRELACSNLNWRQEEKRHEGTRLPRAR